MIVGCRARIVFREGRTKACGMVLSLVANEDEMSPGAVIGDRNYKKQQNAQQSTAARLTAMAALGRV